MKRWTVQLYPPSPPGGYPTAQTLVIGEGRTFGRYEAEADIFANVLEQTSPAFVIASMLRY